MNIIVLFKIAIAVSGLVSTALAGYVYSKKEHNPPLQYLLGLLFANVIYAISYFFEITANELSQVKFSLYMEYAGIFFIPVFWVFIAWSYHPDNPAYNRKLLRKLRVLYSLPVLVNLLVWTNDWHHLIYHSIGVDYSLSLSLLKVDRALGFWVINGVILVLYTAGAVRMIMNFIGSKGSHSKQYLLLLLATVPPVASYLLILQQAVPYGLDLNPIAFAVSGIFLFWGIANLQLFNILPVAQKLVVGVMQDAMIVLDDKGRLVECNTPAKQLLREPESSELFKMPIQELNPQLSPLFEAEPDSREIQVQIPRGGGVRTYSLYKSFIIDKHNKIRGKLYLLHDLTEIHTYVKELEHLASTDGLTKLLNHRQFITLAELEASGLQKRGRGIFSLVMFDLDNVRGMEVRSLLSCSMIPGWRRLLRVPKSCVQQLNRQKCLLRERY